MRHLLSILSVTVLALAALAEPPVAFQRASRIYRVFRSASSNHRYEVVTNGAAIAAFLDGSLKGLPVWSEATHARIAEISEARLLIVSSMLGDRLDVLVSGRPRAGTPLASMAGSWPALDARLSRLVPANVVFANVSSVAAGNPFELVAAGARELTVDAFASLLPAGSVAPGSAFVVAPVVAGEGLALVGAIRTTRPEAAAAAIGSLGGCTIKPFFRLSRVGQRLAGDAIVHAYVLTSSIKDAADPQASGVSEFVRLGAVLTDVFGPLTLEAAVKDDLVFFEVGPSGDLSERLAASSGRSPFLSLSLLPLGMPSLEVSTLRSVSYASPSTFARRGLAGIPSAAAPRLSGLAPDGDGCTALTAVLPDGAFVWGWSLTENEIRATIADFDGVRPIIQALLMQGAEARILGKGATGGGAGD